ncbi:MAG TPA: four helix bundle protein [Cyclobacteriaceae bacterium]|jgi:four helix bundle protein|nr:four helix bundle protein [Cytophagales bacterium]HNT50778.1 four helix bundle protein [Cyclobacteriaceae bacterium]
MKDYKKLNVWHKAHENVLDVYRLTKNFPKEEQFGLTSQLRRAIVSVANNIVEGCGKHTEKDFANFLQIALGSCQESEYLIMLSFQLEYLKKTDYERISQQVGETKAMLISLIKRIRN